MFDISELNNLGANTPAIPPSKNYLGNMLN